MEKELPKNWVECNLFDIANVVTGKKDANHSTENGIYTFFTCAYKPLKSDDYDYDDEVLILPGNGANVGEVFYFNGKFQAYQRTYIVEKIKISPRYLYYYFLSNWRSRNENEQFGTATNYIKIGNFQSYNLEIAPLSEQNRIVAKLDSLFAQLESIKTSMAKIPVLLKNFRQQVLTQAVTGKLTEEWRKTKELEDWKEGSIEDFLIKKGIFDGPFGSHLKTEDYLESGNVRVIRLENIDSLKFNDDKSVYVSDEKYTRLIRHEVFEGDIIFSSFISERIRACILPFSAKKMIAKADCFCLRNDKQVLNTEFFSYVLVNPLMFEQLLKEVRGATRPRINTTILRKSQIIVPPIKEQQEIVSRVESLFAKADAIEEKYKNLKAKIATLPQTILHKAFKGELTEQLESDGDAKVLLEEIAALKNGEKPKKAVSKKYVQPDDEVLRIVAEPAAVDYHTKVEKTTDWYDQRFELWVSQQGLAARGTLDKATLRELFDAMDDEDK